jgi:cyclopropane-fatty-acyl-phospholipid synthase
MGLGIATSRQTALLLLRRVKAGHIELVEGSKRLEVGARDAPLRARVVVRSARFWPAFLRGSSGLADAYADGAWECDDLVSLVRIAAREIRRLDGPRRRVAALSRMRSRQPRMTRAGSRRNVAAHYDMGNELFALFLDETMTYSCGYFASGESTLAEAQVAKLDLVCSKLALTPDDHLLEIGTGWGALAVHAASQYGCRVTTTTISREQRAAALSRVHAAGLADQVTVLSDDYRDLSGRYDKLVSIEMIEGVGWQYFDKFFRCCSRLLAPHGLMLLQTIVIEDQAYEVDKASSSFIMSRIFPGACLPSQAVIERCVRDSTDMRVTDTHDITPHYAVTLHEWRARWQANAGRVSALGGDDRLVRMWDLYFAWCEAGFRERRIRDLQVLLAKPAAVLQQASSDRARQLVQ